MAGTIKVYKDGNVWVAKKDNATKASAIRNTQKEAYIAARSIALNQGLTITVYHATGGIRKVVHPKANPQDDDCFITTACVHHYKLSDDCYQLTTLRYFRDNYVKKLPNGDKLIARYYSLAPKLVVLLNHHPNRNQHYYEIFARINLACTLIDQNDYKQAKIVYVKTLQYLTGLFCLK